MKDDISCETVCEKADMPTTDKTFRVPLVTKIIWTYTAVLGLATLLVLGPVNRAFSNSHEIVAVLFRYEVPRDHVVYAMAPAYILVVILHWVRIQKFRRK
jgi:hypothetical protein